MNPEFEKAAKLDGGKYKQKVQEMQSALVSNKTEQERFNAAIDTGCKHLQSMKTDGSTIEDVITALKHVVDTSSGLVTAVKHGA